MSSEAEWLTDRTLLQRLLQAHPTWTTTDFALALHRSISWVKKWRSRIHHSPDTSPDLHSRSRAPLHPPARLDPTVITRILDIRDHPPENLHRIPGPRTILYFLARDPDLLSAGVRLPRSPKTVWQILRSASRIPGRQMRIPHPLERPEPMTSWQCDFKDVSTVPADPDGKRQHVVEVLNVVDIGSSLVVDSQTRPDFTAETTLRSLVHTFQAVGLPDEITVDRDPRFVGGTHGADFPSPLVRALRCLGIKVTICPPQRPDKNAFVERYHRTLNSECLRQLQPRDLEQARTAVNAFRQHYNTERPNQAISCGNRPPATVCTNLPARPRLPEMIEPDAWLTLVDGERYVRKVRANGTVSVDQVSYYVDQAMAGQYVSLRLQAGTRMFVVEARNQMTKEIPIKGLLGDPLPTSVYIEAIAQMARNQAIGGRPIGRQLPLPLETIDTNSENLDTMSLQL